MGTAGLEPPRALSMGLEQPGAGEGGRRGTPSTRLSTSQGNEDPGWVPAAAAWLMSRRPFVLLRKVPAVSYWSSPLEWR